MARGANRNRLPSTDGSIASYGMGSTFASASYAGEMNDNMSVEVSDVYHDPLSLKPIPRRNSGNRTTITL